MFFRISIMEGFTTGISQKGNPIYRVYVKGRTDLLKLGELIYQDVKDNYVYYKKNHMTQENPTVILNATERIKFRTNISKSLLDQLKVKAIENNTYVNHLIETGLLAVLKNGNFIIDTQNRPKDRIQYKTTYDKMLLEEVKLVARKKDIFINDIIEYGIKLIKV